jgi:TRAP-type C4-dicarboxylate transport system permease small subunit
MYSSKSSTEPIIRTNKSERDFSFLISFVFICLTAYKYFIQSWSLTQSSIGLSLAIGFLAVGFIKPSLLRFPLKLWMRLGDLMGKFVSPLVLGMIFFCMITPVAILIRIFGRDELRLKRIHASSFWVDRDPERQPSKSFNTQF